MDQPALDTMLLHLANGSLDGAPVRVLDVAIVLSDGGVRSGYPSRVSIGGGAALVLTSHGVQPTLGEDIPIDLDDAIWTWASASDGSTVMFGADAVELHALLSQSLEDARAVDKRSLDVGRLGAALGLLSHAMGNLDEADRFFRGAMGVLVMTATPRESGDLWMKIADVYADMKEWDSWKMAIGQAISAYDLAPGVHHPITTRAKQALAGRA